jgi:hypothetical protein
MCPNSRGLDVRKQYRLCKVTHIQALIVAVKETLKPAFERLDTRFTTPVGFSSPTFCGCSLGKQPGLLLIPRRHRRIYLTAD